MEISPYLQIYFGETYIFICNMVSESHKSLKDRLKQTMKARGVKIPELSTQTGIPKDRMYKWYKEGTQPKADDADKLEKWILGEMELYPHRDIKEEANATTSQEATVSSAGPAYLEKSIENLTENQLRNTAIIERLVSLLEMQISSGKQTGTLPVPLGPAISKDPAAGGESLSGNTVKAGR